MKFTQKNILLIRLKSIGDVIQTLPAVHAVRNNFPAAKITFLTSKENVPLLFGFREVDAVIGLDRAALRSGNPLRMLSEFTNLLRQLRAGKFLIVIDLQGYGETAWLTWFSGAPQRWRGIHGAGRNWAYTKHIKSGSEVHGTQWHLRLLEQCGLKIGAVRNEYVLPEETVHDAHVWFANHRLDPTMPTIYLQPFTSSADKNWPLENYLAVARHWQERGVQIVFGGGPADSASLEPARRASFVVSAGVSLLVTGGLMQLSTLVLGGDTGAVHLAVAQGKRVLMLMQEVTPGSPIPFQHPDWVLAPKSGGIAKISVTEVNMAVAQILRRPAGNVSC